MNQTTLFSPLSLGEKIEVWALVIFLIIIAFFISFACTLGYLGYNDEETDDDSPS